MTAFVRLPGLRSPWLRSGASIAATALCGYLSVATSALPPCPNGTAPAARRPLHFESGEQEITVRVTADEHPLVLTLGDGLMLPADAAITEVDGHDPEADAGAPPSRYWLACATTFHEGLAVLYEDEHERADLHGDQLLSIEHDTLHLPTLELGPACELTLVRTEPAGVLDTSVSVSPVFNSCEPAPYYSVVVEIVE